jgi:hypothetical protein
MRLPHAPRLYLRQNPRRQAVAMLAACIIQTTAAGAVRDRPIEV